MIEPKKYEGLTIPDEKHTPGELYKTVRIDGHIFHIYYGYENGSMREADIIPIFPDLIKEEVYDENGYRVACALNDGCEYFQGRCLPEDADCISCRYYTGGNDFMAICSCPYRRSRRNTE